MSKYDAGDMCWVALTFFAVGVVVGMFLYQNGTYSKSALLEKGIIEYDKKGEIIWTKEVE